MNKKVTISLLFVAFCAIGTALVLNTDKDPVYQPRTADIESPEGVFNHFANMRSNQITGNVDPDDYYAVKRDVLALRNLKNKAEFPLRWQFAGPDNIGGRTRAIVVDKNNPAVLYAGGVGGPVFKSENRGASWYPLPIDNDGVGVVSMAQTNNGILYAGTGENFAQNAGGAEGSVFPGSGIYKCTDGVNFELLNNTTSFGYIAALAEHPSQNIIFAATQAGLRYSNDDGASWQLARAGGCKDVKINKNGVLMCYVGSALFRSSDPTNSSSYDLISGINSNENLRIAWSESDPNYCYVITSGTANVNGVNMSGSLTGLYKSTDAGVNFTKVVNQRSSFFAPLGGFGWWCIAIGVHPRDRDRVFFGGVAFAEWTLENGPKIVGNQNNGPTNPFGIHADKHTIVFDNSGEDPIMYIGTDGGVSRTTNADLDRYQDRFINYTTTQYYAISANPRGELMGGTQDNDNILVSQESYPRLIGLQPLTSQRISGYTGGLPGDGFENAMSHYNQDVMFIVNQRATLARTVDGGKSPLSFLWDNRVTTAIQGVVNAAGSSASFAFGLHLWETPEAVEGKLLNGPSDALDSIYHARLFLMLDNGIWMCNNATKSLFNPNKPSNDNVRWFRVATPAGKVVHMATTRDGNSLFAGTSNGNLYRLDGLNKANFDTTELPIANQISDSLTLNNITGNLGINGRHITDVSVDPNDDNRVLLTVGNYGNTSYVFITENALDPVPTWTSIQSNLPRFPVYSGLISADDPNVIVLGTEYGIYATSNGFSSSPNWVESRENVTGNEMPISPVLDIEQVAEKPWTGHTIYMGTHGMGMWKSSSLLTSIKPENKIGKTNLIIYPNPAHNNCTLRSDVKGSYTLNVYNLKGALVFSDKGMTNGSINLSTSTLSNGNYFVEIIGDDKKAVSKLIVQH